MTAVFIFICMHTSFIMGLIVILVSFPVFLILNDDLKAVLLQTLFSLKQTHTHTDTHRHTQAHTDTHRHTHAL